MTASEEPFGTPSAATRVETDDERAARTLLAENSHVLRRFILGYMCDQGIALNVIRSIVRGSTDVSYTSYWSLSKMLDEAIFDLTGYNGDSAPTFDIENVITAAPALLLLVEWADSTKNSRLFPEGIIPSDELVDAALLLFHALQNDPLSYETRFRKD